MLERGDGREGDTSGGAAVAVSHENAEASASGVVNEVSVGAGGGAAGTSVADSSRRSKRNKSARRGGRSNDWSRAVAVRNQKMVRWVNLICSCFVFLFQSRGPPIPPRPMLQNRAFQTSPLLPLLANDSVWLWYFDHFRISYHLSDSVDVPGSGKRAARSRVVGRRYDIAIRFSARSAAEQ